MKKLILPVKKAEVKSGTIVITEKGKEGWRYQIYIMKDTITGSEYLVWNGDNCVSIIKLDR
jgi:hypothetical protein